jgi:hypothetical protein
MTDRPTHPGRIHLKLTGQAAGPARVRADGAEQWWRDGLSRREGGPAVTRADGAEQWWRDGGKVAPPAASV